MLPVTPVLLFIKLSVECACFYVAFSEYNEACLFHSLERGHGHLNFIDRSR